MKNRRNIAVLALAAVGLAAGLEASAKAPDPVLCTLRADYSINRVVRAPFTHTFQFTPGEVYDFDFSTAIRFRYMQARASVDATTGHTTVEINYYNDVGVFTFVELGTTVVIRNNNEAFHSEGRSTFFTSLGPAGEHTTDYTLSCTTRLN